MIPWVFHRDGAPIKDFRGAWQTACENAGVPDVGDRDDYQRTFALAQCPIESVASARLQSRSQRAVSDHLPGNVDLPQQAAGRRDRLSQVREERQRELDDLYPTERGQVGNSQLLIRTGWCQYDIDVMRLNNLALVHE